MFVSPCVQIGKGSKFKELAVLGTDNQVDEDVEFGKVCMMYVFVVVLDRLYVREDARATHTHTVVHPLTCFECVGGSRRRSWARAQFLHPAPSWPGGWLAICVDSHKDRLVL